jgi:hypothetical protein
LSLPELFRNIDPEGALAKIPVSEENDKFAGYWIIFETFKIVVHATIPCQAEVFKPVIRAFELFWTLHMSYDSFYFFIYLFVHNFSIIHLLMKRGDLFNLMKVILSSLTVRDDQALSGVAPNLPDTVPT